MGSFRKKALGRDDEEGRKPKANFYLNKQLVWARPKWTAVDWRSSEARHAKNK